MRSGCHQEAAFRPQVSAVCEGQGGPAPAPPRGTSGSRFWPLLVQSGVCLAHHLELECPGIGIFDDGLDSFSKSAVVLLMSQIILLTICIRERFPTPIVVFVIFQIQRAYRLSLPFHVLDQSKTRPLLTEYRQDGIIFFLAFGDRIGCTQERALIRIPSVLSSLGRAIQVL